MLMIKHYGSLSKMFREHARGFIYLMFHPYWLRRLVIRELLYGRRYNNKLEWIKWQIFDAYTSTPQHGSEISYRRPVNYARIRIIADMIKSLGSNMVLDVGCGDGAIGKAVEKVGAEVTSTELPLIAMMAKKRYGVSTVIACDAENLPFCNETFDMVLASELVEHLWSPQKFIEEAYRVIRNKGHLIIATPEGPESLRYDAHKHYFTVEILEKMLNGKFALKQVEKLGPICAPTSTIILLFQKIENSTMPAHNVKTD